MLVKVDYVSGDKVTYTTIYLLELWDTPRATWHRNFRLAENLTESEREVADGVPTSRRKR